MPKTMEHLNACDYYSVKIWTLLGRALMLSLSRYPGEYILAMALTPLEKVFNTPLTSFFYTFRTVTLRRSSYFYCKQLNMILYFDVQLQVP
jgi:hypothetical protein